MTQKHPGWTSQCQIMIQPDPIVQKPTFSAAQPHTQVLVKPGLSDLLNVTALGSRASRRDPHCQQQANIDIFTIYFLVSINMLCNVIFKDHDVQGVKSN